MNSEMIKDALTGIYTLDTYESNIDIKFMIGNADKNLYEAKRTGRNRSVK